MNLNKYVIQSNQTILQALKNIEENKLGFVIVLSNETVVGTLTDGDIRRALILGENLKTKVSEIIKSDFEFLYTDASFEIIVEKFKDEKIEFLPVITADMKLNTIITKNQFHELLLEGKPLNNIKDLKMENIALKSFEIFNRPWGFYKTVFLSEFVQAKVIQVFPLQQLSLQYHKKREEHWIVIKGTGLMTIGESERRVGEGSYIFIPKGCQHRIKNTDTTNPLIISEVQLGTYFGEDDIIRIADDYNRI